MTFDGERPPVQTPELIKGLLPVTGIAFLGGQSGAGKTFIAIDLSVALSCAGPSEFFGRSVKQRVGVAIFAAEGEGTLAARLHVAKELRGVNEPLPIAYFSTPLDLCKDEDVASLCDRLVEIDKYFRRNFGVRLGAVIIDTVAAACGMESENDNAEAAKLIRNLGRLRDATNSLIMPVHHYGKTEDTGLRGASAFRAGADVVLSVLAKRNKETGETTDRRLALAKSRTSEEGPISGFDLAQVLIGMDEDGAFGSCAVAPNGNSATSAQGARQPQSSRDFRTAFDAAVNGAAGDQRALTGGRNDNAVKLQLVRDEFCRLRSNGLGDKRKQIDAARKAFGNACKALQAEFLTWTDDHGLDWVKKAH